MRELNANQRECAVLITALIEAELSDAQRERLNELCRQDQGCRKLYAAVMSVHGMLLWSSQLSVQKEEQHDESDAFLFEMYEQARLNRVKHDAEVELAKNLKAQSLEDDKRRQHHDTKPAESKSRVIIIPKAVVYSGLAAAVLLSLVLLWPVIQNGPSSVAPVGPEIAQAVPEAQLIRSHDAVWSRSVASNGMLAGAKAWTLKQGFAEIAMPSGASVILHGPTTFRLIDENALALDDGRLTAEVPDRAKYFTVKTRSMDVVDLGTRFGVNIEADGATSASVFEGRVEVHEPATATGTPRIVPLTAGQQVRADASGQLAESVTAIDPDHRYVARWGEIQRRVVVQGQARFFVKPPVSVRHGDLLNTDQLIVFEESTVVLDEPMSIMSYLPEKQFAKFITVPAGRKVVSYFIHNAPEADAPNGSRATATLTFPGRILGVVGNTREVRKTTALFGLASVNYVPEDDNSTYGIDPGSPDHFAIGGLQNNTLTIHLAAGDFADQVRVLVEVPDPSIRETQD